MKITKKYFENLKSFALSGLSEHLTIQFQAETSHFVRINAARVRQAGVVEDASIELALVTGEVSGELRKSTLTSTLTGQIEEDQNRIRSAMKTLRSEIAQLPIDPYAELPSDTGKSSLIRAGRLLSHAEAVDVLLEPVKGLDLSGIYACGTIIRAMADTAGTEHYFETQTFSLDYSVFTPEGYAIKGTFAGADWSTEEFRKEIARVRSQLPALSKPSRKLEPGNYRTYLAPAATEALVTMLSWGAIGEASIRQEDSPLVKIRSGEKLFSPLFSLDEDFRSGAAPRFGGEGRLPPERLPLIEKGKLVNALVNTRTEKEYGVRSNGANSSESLRSISVGPGNLKEEDVLAQLGTGLYLSNLHYLNWSDQRGGMITGMTRYACFWVENGKIVGPIENLRFDDSLFSLLGTAVEDFTTNPVLLPETGTYESRHPGGAVVPGLLLRSMRFTL